MKRKIVVLISMLTLLGIAGTYLFIQNISLPQGQFVQEVAQEETQITLIVQAGDEEIQYELSDVVGKTALEATIEATGGEVVTEGEGEMAFITSINGIKTNPGKREFWELVINGEPAKVGAGSYLVQTGDNIEWRISTY